MNDRKMNSIYFKEWSEVMKAMLGKGSLWLVAVMMLIVLAACGGNNAGGETTTQTPPETNNAAPAEQPAETGSDLSGEIKLEGSSTVYPISEAVAEEFMGINDGVNVTVGLSGSSNGFKAIINGEADIANASRTIKGEELDAIKANGDDVVEMPVAYDGITVVINPQNDWATDMTPEELKKIWEKDSTVKNWSDVRPEWPNEPIQLYAPGTASGTFEYFTEAINGEAKVSREDFTPSEDDNVLVQGVAGEKYAMGYFGFAYYEENQDKLKAVSINGVAPSMESIADGSYTPLSRQIYIYPLKSALERPEVQEFIKFYMSEEGGQTLSEEVGYVRLGQEYYDKNLSALPQ